MKQGTFLVFGVVAIACMGFAHMRSGGRVTVEAVGNITEAVDIDRKQLIAGTIDDVTTEYGFPRGFVETFIDVESSWKEWAFNPEKTSKCYAKAKTKAQREKCGAYGLMQPICGLHAGDIPCRDLFHGPTSIRVAIKNRLAPCWKKHKTIFRTAKCFNGAGPKADIYAAKFMKAFKRWS